MADVLNFTNSTQVKSLEEQAFREFQMDWYFVTDRLQFITCILGALSTILTLATTIRNKDFSEPCFFCYQAVGVAEFILATFSEGPYYWYNILGTNGGDYIWFTWKFVVGPTIMNGVLHFDVAVTVFLSLQRFVACLLPKYYPLMNTPRVCRRVVAIAVVLSLIVSVPIAFMPDTEGWTYENGVYILTDDDDLSPQSADYPAFFDAYRTFEAAAIFVALILSIAGSINVVRRKRKLLKKGNQANHSASITSLSKNLRLCCLQLTQALPFVINLSLFSVANLLFHYTPLDGNGRLIVGAAYTRHYMWGIADLTDSLAHFFHFYFYITFSGSFRKGFMNRFLSRWTKKTSNKVKSLTRVVAPIPATAQVDATIP